MTIGSIGGGDWFYDPVTGSGQRGVAGGVGLNNVGLLVTTWGIVVSSGADHFVIRDSGAAPGPSQVKVLPPAGAAPPNVGSFVTVTGAVSCENVGGTIYPVLHARSQADIVGFPAAGF